MTSQTIQQVNPSLLVHRTLLVPTIRCNECVQTITDQLSVLEGMSDIDIDLKKKRVHLHYDVSKVMLSDIKKALKETGYPLSTRWFSRFRQAMYQYQDENIRGNAAKGGSCCSNPSDIYANRKHRH